MRNCVAWTKLWSPLVSFPKHLGLRETMGKAGVRNRSAAWPQHHHPSGALKNAVTQKVTWTTDGQSRAHTCH